MTERKEICGNCRSWRAPEIKGEDGECWSPDRLDDDMTKGPASYTFSYRTCEAWMPKLPTRA